MSTPARKPLRVPPAILWGFIALCVGVIIWKISALIPLALAGQAYLLIAILLAFRYWPPMKALVIMMPVAHRVVAAVLLGGMILGHYTLNGRTYFPFVVWAIFPHVEDKPSGVSAHEFIATTANGSRVRLIVEQLFPSLVQVDRLEDFPPDTTERLARALAKKYNQLHAGNPVRTVDLMAMSVPLHPRAGESRAEPSCELLKQYDVSSDR